MHATRVVATTVAAVALSALAAAPSPAATIALGGSPMNVYVGDLGQLQAFRTGQSTGIYFAPTSPEGDAGLFLALRPTGPVYGFDGTAGPHGLTDYTAVSQSAVTGSGTPADPLTVVTRYDAGAALQVAQTTTYVNGAQQFTLRWDVTNPAGGGPVRFKALVAADFFFEGSDRGTGIFTPGPPRFVGGTNADTGNSGGFAELTGPPLNSAPWTAYQALSYGSDATEVWGKVEGAADSDAPSFDDSVVGEQVDNAGGVEWDTYATTGLPDSTTATFALSARSAVPSALQITPSNAGSPRGVPINFTAVATNTDGVPYAGRTIRYAITGANPLAGASATLDANGSAVLTDPGANAGADTLVAFVDFNNDGTREPAEPQASALATFVDNVPPTCTVKITGDRPGGSGGAGKPLVISVNCSETATVTVQTTLQPPARRSRAAAAAVDKRKKKRKKVTIKLKTTTVTATAGKRVPISLKIPRSVRKKYAGKTLKATITVTARDASGNVKKTKTTRTVKLAKAKKRKHRH
jgi:hypothetical protein